MKIAFFGLPLAALLLSNDGHDVVLAALCRPDCPGERRLKARLGARVSVKPKVESAAFAKRLAAAKPDLVVSWFWTTRLPVALVDAAPFGGFGVHPSLLPRHRGPDPYYWAIAAGDAVTGVTAHRLAAEYDTGEILARRELPIDPAWSAWTLAKKLDRPSLALLREVTAAFARGTPPVGQAQDETQATLAPAPTDDELEIDWHRSAADIVRSVRAASPSPGAYTYLGETEVTVTRATIAQDFPRALEPGEAAVKGDGRVVVRARDGAVELLAGTVAGDDDEDVAVDAAAMAALVRA